MPKAYTQAREATNQRAQKHSPHTHKASATKVLQQEQSLTTQETQAHAHHHHEHAHQREEHAHHHQEHTHTTNTSCHYSANTSSHSTTNTSSGTTNTSSHTTSTSSHNSANTSSHNTTNMSSHTTTTKRTHNIRSKRSTGASFPLLRRLRTLILGLSHRLLVRSRAFTRLMLRRNDSAHLDRRVEIGGKNPSAVKVLVPNLETGTRTHARLFRVHAQPKLPEPSVHDSQ